MFMQKAKLQQKCGIVKKKNFNKNINADNPCIVLNYEKYNPDNGETVLADAIIQLDGYTRTEDYISDIDYY